MGKLVVVALLLVSGATWADSADAIVRNEAERLVEEFEGLAKWCTKKKLLKSRNRLFESILHFRPDHAASRRWLRYKKDNKGRWVRSRYREPKDFKPEFLPEFRKRRVAITARFCGQLLKLLDREEEDPSPRTLQRVLDAVIAADPDNAEARERNDEVRSGGRWLLRETVNAHARRRMLRVRAREILKGIPAPQEAHVPDLGNRLGMKRACRGVRWTAYGTVPARELAKAMRVSDAVVPLLDLVFDIDGSRHGGTFFVCQTRPEYYHMLDTHPDLEPRDRKYGRDVGGMWLRKQLGFLNHGYTPETRLDSVCRMVTSAALSRNVTERARQGWIIEGVGLYLSHLLLGTRYTIFVKRSEYAGKRQDPKKKLDLWKRIQMPRANWVGLALELHDKGKRADYPFLLSKNLNQMVIEDLLHSYALAAYLIEGRPDKTIPFLRSFGQKRPPAQTVEDVLGTTLPGLEKRVVRWMRERKQKK